MEIFEIMKKTANVKENYTDSPNNYTVAKRATADDGAEFRELTVTITLAEYRELVSNVATSSAYFGKEYKLRTDAEKRCEDLEKRCAEQAAEIEALRAALQASSKAESEG